MNLNKKMVSDIDCLQEERKCRNYRSQLSFCYCCCCFAACCRKHDCIGIVECDVNVQKLDVKSLPIRYLVVKFELIHSDQHCFKNKTSQIVKSTIHRYCFLPLCLLSILFHTFSSVCQEFLIHQASSF